MTDAPIVIAKRRKDKTLHIVCPICERHHSHGTGGRIRVCYHRLAHCADCDLPKHLRHAATPLSYNIVVLDELRMTETEFRKLFKDMDAIADDPMHDPADCQIAFRRLQKE